MKSAIIVAAIALALTAGCATAPEQTQTAEAKCAGDGMFRYARTDICWNATPRNKSEQVLRTTAERAYEEEFRQRQRSSNDNTPVVQPGPGG